MNTVHAETSTSAVLLVHFDPVAITEFDIYLPRFSWTCPRKEGSIPLIKQQEAITMGDKSPKAKDKSRKQDIADSNQKLLAAKAKMSVSAVVPGKKTK